jgi:hypothetical protein
MPDAPPQSWFGRRLPPGGHALPIALAKNRFVSFPTRLLDRTGDGRGSSNICEGKKPSSRSWQDIADMDSVVGRQRQARYDTVLGGRLARFGQPSTKV